MSQGRTQSPQWIHHQNSLGLTSGMSFRRKFSSNATVLTACSTGSPRSQTIATLIQSRSSTVNQTTACLTEVQLEAIKNIYTPLFGSDGELLYPRYSPGAEADALAQSIFGGNLWGLGAMGLSAMFDWERYTVLNVTEHDFTNFSVQDVAPSDQVNFGGIATLDGDLSAFRARGGKFITYHGRRDPLISATNSKRVYDLVSHTLSLPPRSMDEEPFECRYRSDFKILMKVNQLSKLHFLDLPRLHISKGFYAAAAGTA
ncbi:tannase and feruloyl esterase-domain-containing protein [Mycena leptocephala]|nr:tannase and feruloyl esterase-domain-containing protein [Mycena leptocephala]